MLRKLSRETAPCVTYAVGDIHGQLDLYKKLEQKIVEDAKSYEGQALVILLGDMIDRGPKSAQLIEYLLMQPPDGITRLCLRGNHEDMFLQALENLSGIRDWVAWGGAETLASYSIHPDPEQNYQFSRADWGKKFAANVPNSHRQFLQNTPVCLSLPEWFFSHAGINPDHAFEDQKKDDLIWGVSGAESGQVFSKRLIHGHIPVTAAEITPSAINLDTGAYFSGVLTSVRLVEGQEPVLLSVSMQGNEPVDVVAKNTDA
jgi:serine/threonine protein phosphatase 1